jgi:hypothetical protein
MDGWSLLVQQVVLYFQSVEHQHNNMEPTATDTEKNRMEVIIIKAIYVRQLN